MGTNGRGKEKTDGQMGKFAYYADVKKEQNRRMEGSSEETEKVEAKE
jgi:hypothetical protein